MRTTLIAPCGMNCYLCRAYRPDKPYIRSCPGCRTDAPGKSEYCKACPIKNCEKLARSGGRFCFACDAFPCARLKRLDKRYRTRYGMSMIENLEHIRRHGVRQFIQAEKDKWACPGCGEMLCVHKPQCLSCGHVWHS